MFRTVQTSFPVASYRPNVSVRLAVHLLLALDSLEKPSQGSSSCGLSALLFASGLLRDDLPLSLVASRCSDLRTVPSCSCYEVDTVCFEATSFLLFLVAGGVFSFTGWGVLLGASWCLSSKPEESGEEEEEEEDWRSAWFLGDTGVEFTGLHLLLGFFSAGQQIGLGVNLPRTGLLVFLNSLPCFTGAKVWYPSFGPLIGYNPSFETQKYPGSHPSHEKSCWSRWSSAKAPCALMVEQERSLHFHQDRPRSTCAKE